MVEKTLGYWKGAYLTMKSLHEAAVRTARMYGRAMERAKREVAHREAKILVVILVLFLGGCNTLHGALKDGQWILEQGARNTEVEQGRE